MSNFIKGNQFQLFYAKSGATTTWKALAYATSHSYDVNDEYEEVSCKEFGLTPQKELQKTTVSVSGEYIYSDDAFKILSKMQESHNEYSFCFAKISDTSWDGKAYEITGATIPQTNAIAKYFNGKVKVSISSETNSNATMSLTIEGTSAPSDTAPQANGAFKLFAYNG